MSDALHALFRRLDELEQVAYGRIAEALELDAVTALRRELLGKKGPIQDALRLLKDVPAEQRPSVGARSNALKAALEAKLDGRQRELEEERLNADLSRRRVDLDLPGRRVRRGAMHPITAVRLEIEHIFAGMGFLVARGPEAECDLFNFEALNFPPDHPARDTQDTLLLEASLLLRTHTSPVQVRTMLAYEPPYRVLVPGAVYRRDDDVTHSPMFHQVEGLHVDKGIGLAHLKGALSHFARELLGPQTKVRLRASYFPFTEPSVEVDVACIFCKGAGCRVCKESGWLEILGAGIVDPNVLRHCGVDPEQWSGWAFGMGVERIAMTRYGIQDIRLLFESDQRFLSQLA
ncbi:MAG: phenylalanine--tRNA ligase subunit alpha [Myxococcota bacterium]|nr:phenylalanine--tRNA ligase subunit alpha [Myxococcota bacterium]